MDRKSLARRLGALIAATAVVMGAFILRLVQFQLVRCRGRSCWKRPSR